MSATTASSQAPPETKGQSKANSTAAVQPSASSAGTAAAGIAAGTVAVSAPADRAEADGAAATPSKQVSDPTSAFAFAEVLADA